MRFDGSSQNADATPCERCAGECVVSCFNDAIAYDGELGYRVVEENCAGCGACLAACDHGLISLDRGVAYIVEARLAA